MSTSADDDILSLPVSETPPPPLTPRMRRLGIHGPRQSGKTSYLTVLQHYRKTDEAGVVLRDDATLRYLEELWNRYLAAGMPVPRTAGLPTELCLDLQAAGQTWEVLTRDYPGERVQRPIHEEALAWLESCDGILVFLDTTSGEEELSERLNEVDVLLSALRQLSRDGHTIARPLALILTKWDTLGPIHSDDPAHEEQRALAFLNARPEFRQLYHALLQASRSDRVRVFPVSAFGSNRDLRYPPEKGPRVPFNLHAPLVWAMQEADECHAESAGHRANQKLEARRPDYRAALAEYDRLVEEKGINKGPVFETMIEPERQRLRRLLVRRRRRFWLALAPLLLLLPVAALFLLDARHYRQTITLLEDPEQAPSLVSTACRDYVESWNPVGKILQRDDHIAGRLRDSLVEREQREYAALVAYRRENPDDERAKSRYERARDFRQRWPGSEHDAVVRAWEADDQGKAAAHGRKVEHRRAFETLRAQVEQLTTREEYDTIIERYTAFLENWPEGEHVAEVKERRAAAVTAGQHHNWARVVHDEERMPRNHAELIRRAEKFVGEDTPAPVRDQAHKMIERHKKEWDREDYEAVRRACQEARSPDDLRSAQRKALEYLKSSFPPRQRKSEVQKWLDWFDALQKPREYHVTVRRIEIPAGSKLRDLYGQEQVRVTLNLAGTEKKTEWFKGKGTIELGEKLGPFKVQWGKEQTLDVLAEEYDTVSGTDSASGSKTDGTFVLWWANGVFTVKCAKNKDVKIYLECPEMEGPRLPAYGDR